MSGSRDPAQVESDKAAEEVLAELEAAVCRYASSRLAALSTPTVVPDYARRSAAVREAHDALGRLLIHRDCYDARDGFRYSWNKAERSLVVALSPVPSGKTGRPRGRKGNGIQGRSMVVRRPASRRDYHG